MFSDADDDLDPVEAEEEALRRAYRARLAVTRQPEPEGGGLPSPAEQIRRHELPHPTYDSAMVITTPHQSLHPASGDDSEARRDAGKGAICRILTCAVKHALRDSCGVPSARDIAIASPGSDLLSSNPTYV